MTPEERLAELVAGKNPRLIKVMPSGFAVMSDTQFLPGYCLLLAYPKVGQLNEIHGRKREQFLSDMARLGDAVQVVTGAIRINYSIYGNLDPFLHAHVFPRFVDEDERFKYIPPFLYPQEAREHSRNHYNPKKHDELRDAIARHL
jgi:diadenosine tetraphosphate (Ap4A) HIT family hydrolase